MTTFPQSPRLNKAALIVYSNPGGAPQLIAFQYNPESLSRTLEAQRVGGGGEGAPGEALRLSGAPVESVKLEAVIDATDRLEEADGPTMAHGIHPQLAQLELLVYPRSSHVVANEALMRAGVLEVMPPQAPLTLFVWGQHRILPVLLTEFSVTEEAYDAKLNPIRAKVSLGMKVLSYNDVRSGHPAHALFLAHQLNKESLAASQVGGDIAGVTGVSL